MAQPNPFARSAREERALGRLAAAERRRRFDGLILEGCFPQQVAYLNDTARRIALFTPRRSGKTTAFGRRLLRDAILFPRRKQLYCGKTGETAYNAIYQDVVQPASEALGLRIAYNHTTKVITFDNGSTIKLFGLDATPEQMEKLRGGKYHRAIVDEAQSAQQDLRQFLEGVLAPSVADYLPDGGGYIELGGTPGLEMGMHYWWRVTRQLPNGAPDPSRLAGWTVHEWDVTDNPYMREAYALDCQRRAAIDPHYQDDPNFQREWLGRWVLDLGTRVYKYDAHRNALDLEDDAQGEIARSLVSGDTKRWTYIVGVDLGWEDATAVVVVAYAKSLTDPRCYVVTSRKIQHAPLNVVGPMLVTYAKRYGASQFVIDTGGIGKQLAESLRSDYQLPIAAADKREKQNHVGRMNSDFLASWIKVIAPENRALVEEWNQLALDEKAMKHGEWKEGDKWQNHLTDAALYAWRHALHRHARPLSEARPDPVEEMLREAREERARELRLLGSRRDAMDPRQGLLERVRARRAS